ncbi:hypothetical protein ACFL3V_01755 [Nanoarchaeota archaeon]
MESVETLLERARRSLQVAEQVLINTYPLVKDPKLILAVAEDIHAALTSAAEAIIIKKGKYNPELQFHQYLEALENTITNDEQDLLKRLHNIIQGHKESPVEFPRKDHFVICDKKYDCDVISLDDMKKYLFRAGLFVEKAGDTVRGSRKDE